MRFDVTLDVQCAARAASFYVDELGLFDIAYDYGGTAFLLRARGNGSIGLHIGKGSRAPAVFGLRVKGCAQLFERLGRGGLISDASVERGLTRWPGMNTFVLLDPSGNRIVLFEETAGELDARLDIFLRVASTREARSFYVDALNWFELIQEPGLNDLVLQSTRNPSLALHLSERHGDPSHTPRLAISAACCKREFKRLKAMGLLADQVDVVDWPTGIHFSIQDPSGNELVVFEDFLAPAGD